MAADAVLQEDVCFPLKIDWINLFALSTLNIQVLLENLCQFLIKRETGLLKGKLLQRFMIVWHVTFHH